MGELAAFIILAIVTLLPAVVVVTSRNLVRAAMSLIPSFLGVTGLFVLLGAEFVAGIQILIYAGAIAVLMIFAVMLTPRASRDNAEGLLQIPALVLAGLVVAAIAFVVLETDWREATRGSFDTTAAAIGEALLSPFVLPFEIASVLLVAAMIGAIVLVREEE